MRVLACAYVPQMSEEHGNVAFHGSVEGFRVQSLTLTVKFAGLGQVKTPHRHHMEMFRLAQPMHPSRSPAFRHSLNAAPWFTGSPKGNIPGQLYDSWRSYHNHHATYLPMDPYGIPQMGTFIGKWWETIKMGWYPILRQSHRGIGTGDLWHWKLGSSQIFTAPPSILRITPAADSALRAATFSGLATRQKMPGNRGSDSSEAFLSFGFSQLGLPWLVFSKVYDFPSKVARSKWLMQDPQRETTSIFSVYSYVPTRITSGNGLQ